VAHAIDSALVEARALALAQDKYYYYMQRVIQVLQNGTRTNTHRTVHCSKCAATVYHCLPMPAMEKFVHAWYRNTAHLGDTPHDCLADKVVAQSSLDFILVEAICDALVQMRGKVTLESYKPESPQDNRHAFAVAFDACINLPEGGGGENSGKMKPLAALRNCRSKGGKRS